MIRSVDTTPAESAGTKPAETANAAGKSFAAVQAAALKKAATTTDAKTPSENGGAAAKPGKEATEATAAAKKNLTPLNAPAGESWKPVPGHLDYAKIADGPREGKFVNLTTNPRRGQVFTIEEKDGKKVHVYERPNGKKLEINTLPDDKRVNQMKDATRKPGKGETWEPVAGHPEYADILDGPRNGMFVNLTPGPRRGMAFNIVKRDGKEFHVYGEGKNRIEVQVKIRKTPAATPATPATPTTPTVPTGGTSPTGTPSVGNTVRSS